ncbi:27774_t:CDS:2 [Dentiscutata erythropus]|uniref:27774_t:CDS:1 n=1 Tax=Dentiscutata erythropus TaxID=1348616 RepID=A0A9N9GU64_9GLOM|nr:27774_t:CDS:2 [Dentiscutata erythropus]
MEKLKKLQSQRTSQRSQANSDECKTTGGGDHGVSIAIPFEKRTTQFGQCLIPNKTLRTNLTVIISPDPPTFGQIIIFNTSGKDATVGFKNRMIIATVYGFRSDQYLVHTDSSTFYISPIKVGIDFNVLTSSGLVPNDTSTKELELRVLIDIQDFSAIIQVGYACIYKVIE